VLRTSQDRKRHLYPILSWSVVALLVVAAAFAGLVFVAVKMPYKGYAGDSVVLNIAPRTPTVTILTSLESAGVLRDWRLGLVSLRLLHPGKTLKAGEYRFAGERTPEQVVLSIVAGDVVTYRITVPRGSPPRRSSHSSPRRASASGRLPVPLPAARRAGRRPPGRTVPRGLPLPETYTVTRSMSAREIVATMTRAFARRLPANFEELARLRGLSLVAAVTLASLVEKETSIPGERPLVSAVYHNRLRRAWPSRPTRRRSTR